MKVTNKHVPMSQHRKSYSGLSLISTKRFIMSHMSPHSYTRILQYEPTWSDFYFYMINGIGCYGKTRLSRKNLYKGSIQERSTRHTSLSRRAKRS